MKFAGIIAEYDPFHNGHAWQLAQARAMGAQYVAVAMSCGLTQRGALPLLPETVRVQAALQSGADFVFALPAPCACAARIFVRSGCCSRRSAGRLASRRASIRTAVRRSMLPPDASSLRRRGRRPARRCGLKSSPARHGSRARILACPCLQTAAGSRWSCPAFRGRMTA